MATNPRTLSDIWSDNTVTKPCIAVDSSGQVFILLTGVTNAKFYQVTLLNNINSNIAALNGYVQDSTAIFDGTVVQWILV